MESEKEMMIRETILYLDKSGKRDMAFAIWDLLRAYEELAVTTQPKPLTFPPGARRGVGSLIPADPRGWPAEDLGIDHDPYWDEPVSDETTTMFKEWYEATSANLPPVVKGSPRHKALVAVADGKPATTGLMRWMREAKDDLARKHGVQA